MQKQTRTDSPSVAIAAKNGYEMLSADNDPRIAFGRSMLYRVFVECFHYPDEEFSASIGNGEMLRALRHQFEEAGYASAPIDDLALTADYDIEDIQVEYTRLFDVGVEQSACSLRESDYPGSERMALLEEVLRYYEHFGLIPPEQYMVTPDHLLAYLEFMHFMAYQEGILLQQGADPGPYWRAQYDFLTRHLGRWVPMLVKAMEKQCATAYFPALVAYLNDFLEAEIKRLEMI